MQFFTSIVSNMILYISNQLKYYLLKRKIHFRQWFNTEPSVERTDRQTNRLFELSNYLLWLFKFKFDVVYCARSSNKYSAQINKKFLQSSKMMPSSDRPRLLNHFKGHSESVRDLVFHPTENRLASASADKSVHLWSFGSNVRCYKLLGHAKAVNSVAWSPSGEVMGSGSDDRTARLWIPTIRGSSGELKGHLGAVFSVDFNPTGRKVGFNC